MSQPIDRPLDLGDVGQHLEDLAEQRLTLKRERENKRHAIRMETDPAYRERRRTRDRTRHRETDRNRHRRFDTAERLTMSARKRSKRLKVAFDLTVGYVRQLWPSDGRCPVLGYRMVLDRDRDEMPSLDRIDPEGGYVMGNVRIISMRANRLKGDAHAFELERIVAYMRSPEPLTFVYTGEDK